MKHDLHNTPTKVTSYLTSLFFSVVMVLFSAFTSFGQTTVTYTGMGSVTCPANPTATISPAVTGLTFSQMSRGAGVTCGTASTGISGSAFNVATSALSVSGNKYYTFTITSNATTTFTLSKITIVSQVSAAGIIGDVQYKIGAGAQISLGTFNPTGTSANYVFTPASAISVGAGQTLNIFVYGYNAAALGTTFRINNSTSVEVTTAAVTPTLTSTAGSLSFSNQPVLVPSTSQTFNLNGSNLSPAAGSITMTSPSTDYQVSSDNSTWGPTASISYTSATMTSVPVYVRFVPQTSGLKTGNVTFSGGSVSSTPSVAVSGTGYVPPTKLVVTNISPSSPIQNSAFSITISSQDASNTPRNVVANTNVTISLASGTGVLSGTLTGTIAAGTNSIVISGALYNVIESGVSVTATRTSGDALTAGTSASFSVVAATSPIITVNSSLTTFNTTSGVASSSQTLTVSGANLTDNITIVPPALFEISLNNSTWVTSAGSIVLAQSSGTVSSTTIYVRYNPTASGTNSGSIAFTSTGATTQNVSVNGTAIATEPTTQSAITFGTRTANSMIVNFSGGNGTSRILVAYTSAVTFSPIDGTVLTGVNSIYSSATDQGGGNKVVYDGSGSTVTVTGLTAATNYFFAVYEYNGSGTLINYYTTAPGTNSATTLATEPATSTVVAATRVKADQFIVSFTGGAGPNRIVVVRAGSPTSFVPVDGTTYTGTNANFSLATDQGSGNKIVYNGAAATPLTVTGLSLSTTYYVSVYEYNGTSITTNYLTTTFGSATIVTPSNISYAGGAYTQNFDGLPSTGSTTTTGFGQGPYYVSTIPVNGTGLAGWQYANQSATDAFFTINTGSGTSGSAYSYGATSATERAFGSLASSATVPAIGAVFVNSGATPLSSVTITFTGEQWKYTNTTQNTLTFEYSLNGTDILSGTYQGVSGLNFSSPITTGIAATLDGNLPANQTNVSFTFPLNGNWLPGQPLVIRWKDFKDAGANDGLAIDNFTFNAVGPQTPTVQDFGFNFSSVLTNSLTASWTAGNGVSRIVKMNTVNSFTNPVDGQTYSANNVYGGGEQVVYDGATPTVNILNLTPSTTYFFRAYGYNGTGVATKYITTTASNNPATVTTAAPSFPTQLVVLNVNSGADVIVNQPFTVTVEARDGAGSPQNVTQNTVINLSVLSGFGTLTGTISGTMLSGTSVLTISGIIYNTPESNVILNLSAFSGDVLTAAATPAFIVYDIANGLQFANVPLNGVNGVAVNTFNVFAVRPDASIDNHYVGSATVSILSGPGTLSGTLTAPFVNGIATFSNVIFTGLGTYVLNASSGTLASATSPNILINPPIAFTELVVPQYIGCKTTSSTSTDRTPFAYCFRIDNLSPNTTYNVAAGIGLTSEASTVLGAGSIWNGTAYSGQTKNPTFITNASGASGPVWIYLQPSGNSTRFDAGQIHNVRIAYSTGTFGATITPNFVGAKTITALDITTTARTAGTTDDGAFLTTSFSACAGGKHILLFNNVSGTGDPLFAYESNPSTPLQTTQTTLPASVDAIWMNSTVAGKFAAVIPIGANNPNGVQRIEARNADNTIYSVATSATGIWPGGSNSTTVLRRAVLALSNVDVNLSSVVVSASSTNVLCFGGSTGTATATATSALTPITYLWSPSGATTAVVTSLAIGTYTVTATDAGGCTASSTTTITQPSDIAIVGQVTNTTCSGGNTGAIDITVTGGVGSYSYSWSNSSTSEDLTGLGAGTYSVVVTDGNGCTKSASFTIVTQNPNPTVTVTATPSTICAGQSSQLDATGASTYTWSPSGSLNSSTGATVIATPSSTTTYSVAAVDGNGCQSIATITVNVNPLPIVVVSPATSAICEGVTVTLNASGASTYSWSPSAGLNTTSGSTVLATPSTTTVYVVTGTTALGCTSTSSATINVTNVASPSVTTPIGYCQNAVASPLTATPTAGNSLWWYTSPSGGSPISPAPTPSTATPGSTTYYVSQQATAPLSIAINGYLDNGVPDEYTFVALSRIPAGTNIYFTDNGYITGTGFRGASSTDANGSEGFVRWTSVNTISAGTVIRSAVNTADYAWTTSGPITCSACTTAQSYIPLDFAAAGDQIYAFTSTTLDNPLFNVAQQTHLYVFDDTNGFETATSTATGAIPPGLTAGVTANTFAFASANYVNLINDNQTRTISAWRTYMATAANYTTGTGVNPGLPSTSLNVDLGCESPRTALTVNVISSPTVTATPSTILCNGGTSNVNVSATNGTAPYVGTGTFAANAGSHTYVVTDANSCSGSTTITITQPTAVSVTVTQTTPISCNGGNATVTVSATGGTGSYTGTGTFTANAGSHTYVVTDVNSCSGSTTIMVTEPPAIVVTATVTTPIACAGGNATISVSATGGTGSYTGTGTFSAAAGSHTYVVTDVNSCSGSTTITVTEPPAIVVTATVTTPIACAGGNATISVSATGGTGTYIGTGTFSAAAGLHTYVVTDVNSCSGSTTITVTEPPAIVVTATVTTPIACAGGNATISVSATGGTGTYIGTGTFSAAAGLHTYVVTDVNSCSGSTTITVTEPPSTTISSFTPISGCVGSTVTVYGQNFNSINAVDINGILATFVIVSATEITVTIPAMATSGLITVTTTANCSASSATALTITNCSTGMTINLKAYLQGYYVGGGMMQSVLLNQAVIGAIGTQADSIQVEIYNGTTFALAGSTKTVLMTNGTASATLNGSNGNYFIAIRQRNSVLTWSAVAVALSAATPVSYDFSISPNQSFSGMAANDMLDGVYSIFTGDVNQDEFIDASDFPQFDTDNLSGACCNYLITDFNGDGFVDASDFPVFDNNNLNGIFSIHP